MEAIHRLRLGAFMALCLLAVASGVVHASWQVDGTPLCQAAYRQGKAEAVSDGAGGILVFWNDERAGIGIMDIYGQRLDAAGEELWTPDGVAVCVASGTQSVGEVVSDGAGGAIVVWTDNRNGSDTNVYAQRIGPTGIGQWTTNGVAVCTEPTHQSLPRCTSDGAGGVVIAWMDIRNGDPDIYAQRVNASGVAQWTADGVDICPWSAWPSSSENPDLASDGAGGAILVWQEGRYYDYDIYTQRIAASGVVQWTAGGVVICQLGGSQRYPRILPDGAGGAIMTWYDGRAAYYDIYAQRVNGSGTSQWATDGIALCQAAYDQHSPLIIPSAGGAIVAWVDERMGGGNADVYGQCVSLAGVVQWAVSGEPFCTAAGNQVFRDLAADGEGGAIAVWTDDRGGVATEDVYVQRLDATGVPQWDTNGVALCTHGARQYAQGLVGDGAGGMIATWVDERAGFNEDDLYALRLDASGHIPVSHVPDSSAGSPTQLCCWPNPFTQGTTIRFELPQTQEAGLYVVDAAGRQLRELAAGAATTGPHPIYWDGRDDTGRPLPSGVYYVQLRFDRSQQTRSLIRIR